MKKFMSFEELQEVEESGMYEIEDNGMSGDHYGHHWYTLINNETGEEEDAYIK